MIIQYYTIMLNMLSISDGVNFEAPEQDLVNNTEK